MKQDELSRAHDRGFGLTCGILSALLVAAVLVGLVVFGLFVFLSDEVSFDLFGGRPDPELELDQVLDEERRREKRF